MKQVFVVLAAAATMVPVACARHEAPVAVTHSVPDEVVRNFVVAMSDFNPDTVRGLFTPRARVLVPNIPPIAGIHDIVAYYEGLLADDLRFELTRDSSGAAGGLAAAEGSYRVKNVKTGEYIEQGKWMAVFVDIDGTWRVARLMTNADALTAAPAAGVEQPG